MATFLLFGVTGDLARGKIVPSLFNLYARGEVDRETFSFIGIGRKNLSKDDFHKMIGEYISHVSIKHFAARPDIKVKDIDRLKNNFILSSFYIGGGFADPSLYGDINKNLEMNVRDHKGEKIYCQLSVPPSVHEEIIDALIKSRILSKRNKTFHLIVDKPFGNSASSARSLYEKIVKNLDERNLVLVDHYLAKDSLVELHNSRKAGYLEHFLNDKSIFEIEVVLLESKTLNGRGAFYDSIGAVKDVGQNHMLQVIALASAEYDTRHIGKLDHINQAKTKFISSLSLDYQQPQIFAQYRGYLKEPNIPFDSKTETYFSIGLKSNLKKWKKTKFRITSGKGFANPKAEIIYKIMGPNGKKSQFSIPIVETKNPAYENVLLSIVNENRLLRADISQVVASWKLISKIKDYQNSKSKNSTNFLKIYSKVGLDN